MERAEIYAELEPLAKFVRYSDIGEVRRAEAWVAIDYFLDRLVEVQKVEDGAS